jgi:hypothetical protein
MKNTFFFSHDFGARNDPKLQNLMMEHGCEGIGVYWCIVEQMYEQGGQLPLSSCKSIAYTLHVSCEFIKSVINDFLLFDNDGENFWSESVKSRLNKRAEISEKRREAGKKGWQKTFNNEQTLSNNKQMLVDNTANARQMPSKIEANAEHAESNCLAIKVKESKVKENKENNIKKKNKKKETDKRFLPPSLEEVKSYISEKKYSVDAETFIAFYTSKNWFVGKNKMRDWKAALITWEKRQRENQANKQSTTKNVNEIWEK